MLIAGGLVLPLLRGRLRSVALIALPLLTLALVWTVPDGPALQVPFLGYELPPSRATSSRACSRRCSPSWPSPAACSRSTRRAPRELAAAFVYAGSAIGVAFAGDLITLFIFWELMAIGSTLVVWSGGPFAQRAGLRYASMHLLGGVLLMAGIAGQRLPQPAPSTSPP